MRFLDSEHGLWMVPPGGIWYFLRSTYDWYVCIIRPCACVCANRCIHAHAPIVFSIFAGPFRGQTAQRSGHAKTHRLHKIHGHHLARRRRPFAAAGKLLRGRSRSSALDLRIVRVFHQLRAGGRCQERFVRRGSTHTRARATRSPKPWCRSRHPIHLLVNIFAVTMGIAHYSSSRTSLKKKTRATSEHLYYTHITGNTWRTPSRQLSF